jgi:transcriptional regulator of heat shock response
MDTRQAKLLAAIIDQFIGSAIPVGSKKLLESAEFRVSSATIRAEMSELEELGFLEQPHVSAGRIPTVKGYRVYVKQFMKPADHEKAVRIKFNDLREQYFQHKDRERVYEAVALLSNMMPNVAFATVPHRERVYYLGLANAVRQPEFMADSKLVGGIVEVLEKRLADLVSHVEMTDQVQFFIGDKDLCPEFESCSMLITKYRVRDQVGAIGILGPVRMDYGYNTAALDMVASLLRDA